MKDWLAVNQSVVHFCQNMASTLTPMFSGKKQLSLEQYLLSFEGNLRGVMSFLCNSGISSR
jgi:hypothetical protein